MVRLTSAARLSRVQSARYSRVTRSGVSVIPPSFPPERSVAHLDRHDHPMKDSEAMCTVVVSLAPGERMPLLLLGFRDEFAGRPWQPPARHWPGSPLVGGLDEQAGGTWLAVHPGIPRVSCILNTRGHHAAPEDRRSRGDLPLRAAAEGPQALKQLHDDHAVLSRYDPFFLICADLGSVLMLSWDGQRRRCRPRPTHADHAAITTPAAPTRPPARTPRPRASAPGSPRTAPVPPRSPRCRTPGATGSRWPAATGCPPTIRPRSSPAVNCRTAGCGAPRRSAWSPSAPPVSATTSSPSRWTRPPGTAFLCN